MNSKNQYLLLFSGNEWWNQLSQAQMQQVIDQSKVWYGKLAAGGKVKASQALAREGATISGKNARVFSDGPFAESNEAIGGYLLLEAASLDEAIAIANGTAYKLTGGLFSRKPSHLEQARREFRVGNLYINRNITGALVGRQPFGGFGMSGVGTKAGGREYLLHFTLPRACCENTMRRGFAPEKIL